jgi:hypothetical protein
VVNAVLVLILVSIIAATLMVKRVMSDVPVPKDDGHAIGKRVLVALEDSRQAATGFAIGARIAQPDSGVVHGLLGSPPSDKRARDAAIAQLRRAGHASGLDTDLGVVHGSFAEGIVNAVAEQESSFVIVGQRNAAGPPVLGGPGETVAASIASPVAIILGETEKIAEVVLLDGEAPGHRATPAAAGIAAELAARIGGKNLTRRSVEDAKLVPGQLAIAATASWQTLAATDPPSGAALVMVLDRPETKPDGDLSLLAIRDAQV